MYIEVTKLSILNNEFIKDKTLSIVNISTLPTDEQIKLKGDNDRIVYELYNDIRHFDYSDLHTFPLVPAVEASEKGPVVVVNNPFFSRNHTLHDAGVKVYCSGSPGCPPL